MTLKENGEIKKRLDILKSVMSFKIAEGELIENVLKDIYLEGKIKGMKEFYQKKISNGYKLSGKENFLLKTITKK